MSLFTWGSLPKAQNDSTTIDQAIALAITAHEQDPTAHLGDGESLEQHKNNEIIDHPQGSVMADKLSIYDFEWRPSFESLDGYPDSLGVTCDYAGTFLFYVEYGYSVNAYLEMSNPVLQTTYNENKDMVYAFSARAENIPYHVSGYLKWFNLRWIITDGVLSARFYNGTTYNQVSLSSVVLTTTHYYKIIYIASEETAYFYIDGLLVATIVRPSGTKATSSYGPFVKITALSGTEYLLYYSNLFYSRQA